MLTVNLDTRTELIEINIFWIFSLNNPKKYSQQYFDLFGTFGTRKALMFIPTHQRNELPTQNVSQSPCEHFPKEDKIK